MTFESFWTTWFSGSLYIPNLKLLENIAMSHVFEGKPDDRQSSDVAAPVSRFRPRYRALTGEEKILHDRIKSIAERMEEAFALVQGKTPSRYKSLALTALEEAVMWIVKDLTDTQRNA